MHLKESFVKWGQIVGHDTDSRAAFPAIRQGLWKRPAAGQIQLAENVLSQS